MKLQHYSIETPLEFSQNAIWTLVCENPDLFAKLTEDFYKQTSKIGSGDWSLWEDKAMDVAKYIYLVTDFHAVSLNDKKANSIMLDHLKQLAFDAEHTVQTHEMLTLVTKYFCDLTFDLDYPVVVEDAEFAQLLKSVSFSFLDESTNLCEKLMDFITLLSRLTSVKVIVFVNLRSYLPKDKLQQLFRHCRQCDINVLDMENHIKEITDEEIVLTIDNDLCEFFQKVGETA